MGGATVSSWSARTCPRTRDCRTGSMPSASRREGSFCKLIGREGRWEGLQLVHGLQEPVSGCETAERVQCHRLLAGRAVSVS